MPKLIGIFNDQAEVQAAMSECKLQGMQTSMTQLSPNAQWEVERAGFLLRKDWRPALWLAIGGLLLGSIIGYLHARRVISIPLILPWTAGGELVVAFAGAGVVGTLLALVGALYGIMAPIRELKPGQHMLTIFCMAGMKNTARCIVKKQGGRVL